MSDCHYQGLMPQLGLIVSKMCNFAFLNNQGSETQSQSDYNEFKRPGWDTAHVLKKTSHVQLFECFLALMDLTLVTQNELM